MSAPAVGEKRLSVIIDDALDEKMKDVCWWERETVKDFIVAAINNEIDRRENVRRTVVLPESSDPVELPPGRPYPKRRGKIRTGRPPSV
jgi:hypothetical protein